MKECGCVEVTPNRIKILVGLACSPNGLASAEKLEQLLHIPLDMVERDLEELIRAEIVEAVEGEEFYLTERGESLFGAIYEATGAVI